MSLQINHDSATGVMTLAGALDIYSADPLRIALRQHLTDAEAPALDLAGVSGCDTVGVQLLCSARKTAEASGKRFALRAGSHAVTGAATGLGLKESDLFSL